MFDPEIRNMVIYMAGRNFHLVLFMKQVNSSFREPHQIPKRSTGLCTFSFICLVVSPAMSKSSTYKVTDFYTY
jgi:hypothetical protein